MTTLAGFNRQLPPNVLSKPTFVQFHKGLTLNIGSFHSLVETLSPVAQSVLHSISTDLEIGPADQVQILESVYALIWKQKDRLHKEADNITHFADTLVNILIDYLSLKGHLDKLERLYQKWRWSALHDHDPERIRTSRQ